MDRKTKYLIDTLIANKILQPYHISKLKICRVDKEFTDYIESEYEQMHDYAIKKCMEYEYGGIYNVE